MPEKPRNVFKLWDELKRRKVVRVVLIYLAAAYAILESSDIILPRLGMADWTVNLVMAFLFIGLIIVIILSWIYDITPEGIRVTDIENGRLQYHDADNLQNKSISNYAILEKLSESSLGVMYSALDTALNRKVNLLFIAGWICSDRVIKARLIEKAQAAAGKKMDNSTIYSVDKENGLLFIVLGLPEDTESPVRIPKELESIIIDAIKESPIKYSEQDIETGSAELEEYERTVKEGQGISLKKREYHEMKIENGRKKASLPRAITSKKMTFAATGIIIILIIIFNWSGIKNILGVGNKTRKIAYSHVIAGEEHFKLANYEDAKVEFEIAVKADPTYSMAWSDLAAACIRLYMISEAVMHTIKAVELDDSNIAAAYNLAYALDEKEDYQQAIDWYSKAIEMDSTFLPAYSALGRAYNMSGKPVRAILTLRRALNKFHGSDSLYLVQKNLGYSYLLMDNIDESKKLLDHALASNPGDPETVMYSAKCYEAAKETAKAIELWEKYINLEKDSAKIFQARNHLKDLTTGYLEAMEER